MIGFLILHYKTIEETTACVKSIRALEFEGRPYHILIADNGSADGTYEELAARYAGDGDVTVMTTGRNLGFSAGNNAGWAAFPRREALDALVVCNSDVVFPQVDFPARLEAAEPYDVLGPDIRTVRGKRQVHTSPLAPIRLRRSSVSRSLAIHQARVESFRRQPAAGISGRMHYPSIGLFLWHFRYSLSIRVHHLKNQLYSPPADNVLLQGACLIFSRRYLQHFQLLFEPETFFYYEELLLWDKSQREHLLMRYDPSLQVLHLEGGATKQSQERRTQHFAFVQSNLLEAEKIVLQHACHLPE